METKQYTYDDPQKSEGKEQYSHQLEVLSFFAKILEKAKQIGIKYYQGDSPGNGNDRYGASANNNFSS